MNKTIVCLCSLSLVGNCLAMDKEQNKPTESPWQTLFRRVQARLPLCEAYINCNSAGTYQSAKQLVGKTLALALHPRCGAHSPLNLLLPAIIQHIAEIAALNSLSDNEKNRALLITAKTGDVDFLGKLLLVGADMETQDDIFSLRPLHKAAELGHADAVQLLLRAGANPNVTTNELLPCYCKKTPLHLAAARGHIKSLALLIDAHANINAVDSQSWTPLHEAAAKGNDECVSVLLAAHADGTIQTIAGETPLLIAQKNENRGCVRLLSTKIMSVKRS